MTWWLSTVTVQSVGSLFLRSSAQHWCSGRCFILVLRGKRLNFDLVLLFSEGGCRGLNPFGNSAPHNLSLTLLFLLQAGWGGELKCKNEGKTPQVSNDSDRNSDRKPVMQLAAWLQDQIRLQLITFALLGVYMNRRFIWIWFCKIYK